MSRLGILASHPIQYQAPIFSALSRAMDVEVFYSHRQSPSEQANAGYDTNFEWDIDLFEGYSYRFLKNIARKPGVDHFNGCNNPELTEIIRQGSFDAFLLTGWYLKSYWQAVIACKRFHVPILIRGDSHLHSNRSLLWRILKEPVYRLGLNAFDACLYVGKWNKEYFLHYGVPEKRLFFSPHCVDNHYFRQQADLYRKDKDNIRNELGIAKEANVILFVGIFLQTKRVTDILEAATLVKTHNIEIILVGAGQLMPQLQSYAEKINVKVHFPGFVNQKQLPQYYAIADLLVLPSDARRETWGLVVNEAMAAGIPAIVSDQVGCGPDMIENHGTGEIYPVGNAKQLATAIDNMFMKLVNGNVIASLDEVIKLYSIESNVEIIRETVEQLKKV